MANIKNTFIEFNGIKYYLRPDGYFVSKKNKQMIFLHRMIYENYYKTKIPQGYDIHHKDGNNKNNKISNLEMLTREKHRKIHTFGKKHENNTSGFSGVDWHKSTKKWRVRIQNNYEYIYGGLYNTFEQAVKEAKKLYKTNGVKP